MTVLPKTIQVFLPEGTTSGIRIADVTSRTVEAIAIPRSRLEAASKHPEIEGVGVYYLFGETDDESQPLVYIGEAENCLNRIRQHNQKKDFWNVAVVVISRTNEFTKAHGRYLEHYSLEQAREAGRFQIENNVNPSKPHVSRSVEADLLDNFETISVLVATLGFRIFDPLVAKKSKGDRLFCKAGKSSATAMYTDEGMVVLKGSRANIGITKSASKWIANTREKLLESGVLVSEGDDLRFDSDHRFSSPSGAASLVLGRNTNGWTKWKDSEGKTLDEKKRQ